jgi:hypothetical protein
MDTYHDLSAPAFQALVLDLIKLTEKLSPRSEKVRGINGDGKETIGVEALIRKQFDVATLQNILNPADYARVAASVNTGQVGDPALVLCIRNQLNGVDPVAISASRFSANRELQLYPEAQHQHRSIGSGLPFSMGAYSTRW